ncbi:MAG: tRNA-binding protein [Cenarchaeum symbiont of Oopsacas minuta]|nr:tRNA-binding protein [Cenarchaeum symbiont of Oopsacas minuta]
MTVTYDDFAKLEINTVRITSIEPIAGKTRIAKGMIDVGERRLQVIVGGVDKFDPTSLIGRQAVAVTNLEPKNIAGVLSEAMLLAADVDGMPFWLAPQGDVPDGTRIK